MKIIIPTTALDGAHLTYAAALQQFIKLPCYWEENPYYLIGNNRTPNKPCRINAQMFSCDDLDFLKYTMPKHPFGVGVDLTRTKFYVRPMPPDVVVIYIIGKSRGYLETIIYKHNRFSTRYNYVYESSRAVIDHTDLYIIGSTAVDGLSIRFDANRCETIDGEMVSVSTYGYFIRDETVENAGETPNLKTNLITDRRLDSRKLAAITNGVLDFNQVPVLDTQTTAMLYSCLDEI